MNLREMAYRRGQVEALEKFAAGVGGIVPPAAPKAPQPVVANMPQKPPSAGGMGAPGAAPTAAMGAPAAAGVPATPGMALQTSPVAQTGAVPSPASASVAGQTALQGAQKSVVTHGGGK